MDEFEVEYENGQIVAVRGREGAEWKLRVYDHRQDGRHFCRPADGETPEKPKRWAHVRPAEEVWPELFLWRTSEDMKHMRRLRQDRGVMRGQVEWLCTVLAKRTHTILDCPPGIEPEDACDCGGPDCAECWRKASLDAVMEGRDGSED